MRRVGAKKVHDEVALLAGMTDETRISDRKPAPVVTTDGAHHLE